MEITLDIILPCPGPFILHMRILTSENLGHLFQGNGLLEAELELEPRYLALILEFFPEHFWSLCHQGPSVITALQAAGITHSLCREGIRN